MTTICCTKEEIASDRQFTNFNNGNIWRGKTKIYQFDPHQDTYPVCKFMVGFAGTAQDFVTIAEYFSMPESFNKPPNTKGCLGLVLTENGDIFTFDNYTKWLRVEQPYAAIGSGAGYALGALAAGKPPSEAIKIASKHDAYTGLGIKTYSWK